MIVIISVVVITVIVNILTITRIITSVMTITIVDALIVSINFDLFVVIASAGDRDWQMLVVGGGRRSLPSHDGDFVITHPSR